MDRERFESLLRREIGRISQPELVQCIERHRVPLRLENRGWDYGEAGQTYPCWIGVEDRKTNTAVAYCQAGFGPAYPWGLVFIEGQNTSMGMDAAWFLSLEDAVRNSMFWDGANPPGYEVD